MIMPIHVDIIISRKIESISKSVTSALTGVGLIIFWAIKEAFARSSLGMYQFAMNRILS